MLKRHDSWVEPVSERTLSRGERDAFDEAFAAIKEEVETLRRVRESVREMAEQPVIFTIPQEQCAGQIIEIPNIPVDRWQVSARLLKLQSADVYLCERSILGDREFAVVEKSAAGSLPRHSVAQVLMTGNDPVLLVQDYVERARQTLDLVASNLVGKAQRIVWERFGNSSPMRVIKAISEQCHEAATIGQSESTRNAIKKSGMSNGV
jgi:hypothetical protein